MPDPLDPPVRPELSLLGTWVRALSIRNRLLAWFDRNRRDLPWRADRDPYRVLVSEFMLQQTRVDVVIPYFHRFVASFPDFEALARAPEEDVVAAWSGLGYYRRARWLHGIAKSVVNEHGGRIPRTSAALIKFKGIGAYTAAAVASIAFDEPVAVVDGNVERVVTRLLCLQDEPGAARDSVVKEGARRLVTLFVGEDPAAIEPPEGLRAGAVNQALMELGAVICTPTAPQCGMCPVAKSCIGNRAGLAAGLPKRKEKATTRAVVLHTALLRRGAHFLIVRRPESSLLSRMWELPSTTEGQSVSALAEQVQSLTGERVEFPSEARHVYRHTITNRRIVVHVHAAEIAAASGVSDVVGGTPERAWIVREDLARYGVSSMTRKALSSGA